MKIFTTTDDTGRETQYEYEFIPDLCPYCHFSIESIILEAYLDGNHDNLHSHLHSQSISRVIFKCPRNGCHNLFIGVYYFDNGRFKKLNILPVFPNERNFSEEINSISDNFENIYNQAFQAEQYSLGLIAGPGYRKSLEFLIKDYAIKKSDDGQKGKILNTSLGDVINNFIVDLRIKNIAKRATWLGNDEIHYLRKWEDKDLEVLKILIELTVRWIEMNERPDKFEKEMPE